eukprot:TRINITY_DN23984_c0_g1_i1.p1 TRINITY_DN23984_c0_g1~~TRINITY_DN23984_c0_g1_i1.p1  ORF type:complete len:303 (-),score=47.75 TRINITY_DN23984_c0_g1_i1:101-1009(-)
MTDSVNITQARVVIQQIDLPNETLQATLLLTLVPTERLHRLDLHAAEPNNGWIIQSVTVNKQPVKWTLADSTNGEKTAFHENVEDAVEMFRAGVKDSDAGGLHISIPQEAIVQESDPNQWAGLDVEIRWEVRRPVDGIRFEHENPMSHTRECAWVEWSPNNGRNWWPCIDSIQQMYPDIQFSISVPSGMIAVATGNLTQQIVDPTTGDVTFEYSIPSGSTASGVQWAVGEFGMVADAVSSRLTYFADRVHSWKLVKECTEQVHQMIQCMEEYLGIPYPCPQHKIVFVPVSYTHLTLPTKRIV